VKAVTYINGQQKTIEVQDHTAVLEVELSDGRTIQLTFNEDGVVFLRGWGNIPAKLGNGNSMTFRAQLQFEEQTTCPVCYDRLERCDGHDKQTDSSPDSAATRRHG
jgi:hypothetical protein